MLLPPTVIVPLVVSTVWKPPDPALICNSATHSASTSTVLKLENVEVQEISRPLHAAVTLSTVRLQTEGTTSVAVGTGVGVSVGVFVGVLVGVSVGV